MRHVLYVVIMSVGMFGVCEGMNLEQSFNEVVGHRGIPWPEVIEKTKEAESHPRVHTVDVESAYGGGDAYDARVVCEEALKGDSVAQYSVYRHIKNDSFIAYMLLAISAVFGKFVDSIEEAESLGLGLQSTETLNTLQPKVAKAVGKYED